MSAPGLHPFVIAIVTTYQRPALLRRLLESLESVRTPMAVLVVDNGGDAEVEAVVCAAKSSLEVTRLVPGTNLGCGGGLEYGERAALEHFPQATHFWILDDDAVVAPEALERMLTAMEEHGATVACSNTIDREGRMNWFPGLLDFKAFRIIKKRPFPSDYFARCGHAPVRFSWACGVSLLITREALEEEGPHRTDFWIRGEDIEFSLRLTYRNMGIFVPDAVVEHLQPASAHTPQAWEMECKKELCMLRNHAYIAFHLPHGRRILINLPGSLWRFARNFGILKLGVALEALWQGGGGKRPAGVEPKIFPLQPR